LPISFGIGRSLGQIETSGAHPLSHPSRPFRSPESDPSGPASGSYPAYSAFSGYPSSSAPASSGASADPGASSYVPYSAYSDSYGYPGYGGYSGQSEYDGYSGYAGNPNAERLRLEEDRVKRQPWRKWGPYLSERQWGTVREDYSPDGSAWSFFPHDHARSRAYRWGEDGLCGVCDDEQTLCLAPAFWNGKDPILKERLFGLTGPEGNHGEDVKELYWYLDATPTGSYLKALYKYPQAEFPYGRLVEENRRRGKGDPEFELPDTGIFDGGRYFDIVIEYAKAGPGDILMRLTAHNRGPVAAPLHLMARLWFRNTWSWKAKSYRPFLRAAGDRCIEVRHMGLPGMRLHCDAGRARPTLLFTENETNTRRVWGMEPPPGSRFFKDGFHDFLIAGRRDAVNPERIGTLAAALYRFDIPAGGSAEVRVRLTDAPDIVGEGQSARDGGKATDGGPDGLPEVCKAPFADFDGMFAARIREADAFFDRLDAEAGLRDPDSRLVRRQASAGLVWNRQFYHLDVPAWLHGDPGQPPPPAERTERARNREWPHLRNADILTMPDKWEYPYYCAWDTAFQCVAQARFDPAWAKRELILLTREWYMHPNGQLPAYEWNFGDANPPVHAWAAWRVYEIERDANRGKGDRTFLARVFHKLLLNFTWWVNRKDSEGRNVFQGGFLGLDNIGVFDRSAPLPTGGTLDQADGTAWMAMYSLDMMRMALELADSDPSYEDIASKFFEHFLHIAAAMTDIAGRGMGLWDPADEFYYDVLRFPGGKAQPLKIRSMVGLIPLFAVDVLRPERLEVVPSFAKRMRWVLTHRPHLASLVSHWWQEGRDATRLLSLLRGHRMKRLLRRMLDPQEFLSDYGIRSLSAHHRRQPFTLSTGDGPLTVAYRPGESDTSIFGGNSNWRGPVWMPVNYLIIESLRRFHRYYGDDFLVECPTGSGRNMTLREVADEIARRLARLFLKEPGKEGRRPALAALDGHPRFRSDPHFAGLVQFHEYFHGDDGRGLGASHQTGWTSLVAELLTAEEGVGRSAEPRVFKQ
jgi:hypothetical protein